MTELMINLELKEIMSIKQSMTKVTHIILSNVIDSQSIKLLVMTNFSIKNNQSWLIGHPILRLSHWIT